MLTHIALQNSHYDKAIKLLDNNSKKVSKNDSIELKLIKTLVLKDQGKTDIAKRLLDKIMSEKKLPQHLKQLQAGHPSAPACRTSFGNPKKAHSLRAQHT